MKSERGQGMTKEDWARVEKALGGTYGYAKLQVDGREVTFQRGLVSKNRLGIGTYIDGAFKGVWLRSNTECPEQQYMRPASRFLWKEKDRVFFKKQSKAVLKKYNVDPNAKHHYFDPFWSSVTSIRRHYQKTFSSIELLEVVG